MLMQSTQSSLVIVDVQERLVPVMSDPRRVIKNCGTLMRAARRLAVPLTVSEQYPQGIGPTVVDLREFMDQPAWPKLHFSGAGDTAILAHVQSLGRPQVVIAGIEAHICVLQSALGLKAAGLEVFVVADASASRKVENEDLAASRLRHAGISVVSTEMVLFEWLGRAGTPAFKELSGLVK